MIGSLRQFALDVKVDGQGVPNAVRFAAICAMSCIRPLQEIADENWRFAQLVLGDINKLPFEEADRHSQELIARGAVGWNETEEWRLRATWTPSVSSFDRLHHNSPREFLSKTVVFTEQFARPLVVANIRTLVEIGANQRRVQWELFQMTIFTINEQGEDFDRPYVICPQRQVAALL